MDGGTPHFSDSLSSIFIFTRVVSFFHDGTMVLSLKNGAPKDATKEMESGYLTVKTGDFVRIRPDAWRLFVDQHALPMGTNWNLGLLNANPKRD